MHLRLCVKISHVPELTNERRLPEQKCSLQNEGNRLALQWQEYPSPTSYSSVRVIFVSCCLLKKRQYLI